MLCTLLECRQVFLGTSECIKDNRDPSLYVLAKYETIET